MKIVFGGVRGSYPTADADRLRYGGDTTAIGIEGRGGERVLIDSGTGVRRLRALFGSPSEPLTILFTHYHLDHIAALPLLTPLFEVGRRITFAAPRLNGRTVDEILRMIVGPPFWPISIGRVPAQVFYETLDAAPLRIGALEVRWCWLEHQDGSVAYRVDEPGGGSFVFATDIEWAAAGEDMRREFLWFCRRPNPATLLCFDGAYTPAEYPSRRGWGHSTWPEAVAIARATGIPLLRIIHHAPEHDDATLDAIDRELRAEFSGGALAREGEELLLPSNVA